MFRSINDFLQSWKHETETTQKMLKNLTDESLNVRVTPDGRSLGFIAWHLILSAGEMAQYVGIQTDCPPLDAPAPTKADDVAAVFNHIAPAIEAVVTSWSDEELNREIDAYGEKWTVGAFLSALNAHSIHHRGQMTVLMRQAGLKVPGAYGPSKEEWANYNMPAMP